MHLMMLLAAVLSWVLLIAAILSRFQLSLKHPRVMLLTQVLRTGMAIAFPRRRRQLNALRGNTSMTRAPIFKVSLTQNPSIIWRVSVRVGHQRWRRCRRQWLRVPTKTAEVVETLRLRSWPQSGATWWRSRYVWPCCFGKSNHWRSKQWAEVVREKVLLKSDTSWLLVCSRTVRSRMSPYYCSKC